MELMEKQALAVGRFVLETFPEDKIEELLSEMERRSVLNWRQKPPYDFIMEVVCKVMGVELEALRSESRNEPLPLTRKLFTYLAVKIHVPEYIDELKKPKIYRANLPHGTRLGLASVIQRDETTVSFYLKSVSNYADVDKKFCEDVSYLERIIYKEFKAQGAIE